MKPLKTISIFFLISIGSNSCKKEPKPIIDQEVKMNIQYCVDNKELHSDSLIYKNEAGNEFSISKINYYLSNIKLIKKDSSEVTLKDHQYIDAFKLESNIFKCNTINADEYIGLSMNFGLDSLINKTDNLPINQDNINMGWPESMGGGYHFLKFEGMFRKDNSQFGYAIHIGNNSCQSIIKIYKTIIITNTKENQIVIKININEIFKNPAVYNLDLDGNYTMGNQLLMKKIVKNYQDIFQN